MCAYGIGSDNANSYTAGMVSLSLARVDKVTVNQALTKTLI